jgi:NADP-dependent 3-hydroxy acid dehydrogenase YdfG
MAIRRRPMRFMRRFSSGLRFWRLDGLANGSSGCDPLSGDDIAEIIVFAAGRPENVVIADTLVFPSHQV